jgi:hypothetical protein
VLPTCPCLRRNPYPAALHSSEPLLRAFCVQFLPCIEQCRARLLVQPPPSEWCIACPSALIGAELDVHLGKVAVAGLVWAEARTRFAGRVLVVMAPDKFE